MKVGDTVVYLGADRAQVDWSKQQMSCNDPREILVKGARYEIENVEVDSWCTALTLINVRGRFTDVCFEVVK